MDQRRRDLIAAAPMLLAGITLASFAGAAPARARPAALQRFFREVEERSRELRSGRLGAAAWQDALAGLFAAVSPTELAEFVDLQRLVDGLELADSGVTTRSVPLPGVDLGAGVRHFRKLFGIRKGRAIIPHGHANMVSCHYVLHGACRLRQYDVIDRRAGDGWRVRPAVDRSAGPGDLSSISDERHNVHWLVATEEPTWLLDVLVLDVGTAPGAPYRIFNLDPRAGRRDGDDLVLPVIGVEEGLARYGREA